MPIKRVLVVVKTYPHPSKSYQELVCTAGMLEDGSFIRLYPVDYRYRPSHQWYEKYQWIDVDVIKSESDPRPESYRPNLDTIQLVGEKVPSKPNWEERKKIVLSKPPNTMCGLRELYEKNKTSLGIIKPHKITELSVKSADREWKQSHQAALAQFNLFNKKKPLQKIPCEFSYHFSCGPNCNGHTMQITDWELGILFLNEVQRLGDEQKAVRSVKQRFFDDLCNTERTRIFLLELPCRTIPGLC